MYVTKKNWFSRLGCPFLALVAIISSLLVGDLSPLPTHKLQSRSLNFLDKTSFATSRFKHSESRLIKPMKRERLPLPTHTDSREKGDVGVKEYPRAHAGALSSSSSSSINATKPQPSLVKLVNKTTKYTANAAAKRRNLLVGKMNALANFNSSPTFDVISRNSKVQAKLESAELLDTLTRNRQLNIKSTGHAGNGTNSKGNIDIEQTDGSLSTLNGFNDIKRAQAANTISDANDKSALKQKRMSESELTAALELFNSDHAGELESQTEGNRSELFGHSFLISELEMEHDMSFMPFG